jgi:hypothetical protein
VTEPLEDSFSKLLGRQATEEERQRLYRVRDALGLANNDALWLILVALGSYDTMFREYPRKIAEVSSVVVEEQRATLAATVAAETALVQRKLADAVVATSTEIVARRVEAARWQSWALIVVALILFGGLCIAAGHAIAAGRPPPWAAGAGSAALRRVASACLGAPVGWAALGILLPVAARLGWTGFRAASDAAATARERLVGGATATVAVLGFGALALALARAIG